MNLINKAVIEHLKTGRKYIATREIADNIDVHLTLTPIDKNSVQIQAYLLSKSPKSKIAEIKKQTYTSRNYDSLPVDVGNVCRNLLDKYTKLHAPVVERPKSPKDFRDRVLSITDIFNPSNFLPYTKHGWGKTTAQQAVKYFANTFGEFYQLYGEDATPADFLKFRSDEVAKIYKSQYQRPCADGKLVKKRLSQILSGVNKRFGQAKIVQSFLLDHYPEMHWPDTPIPVEPRTVTPTTESIKTIDYEKYIKLLTLNVRCCYAKVPHAFAATGTTICAERMGESCAPLIGDFKFRGNVGRYYVAHQIDDNGSRTTILKTDSSYRYVFFNQLMIDLISLRKTQLIDDGYDMAEIEKMPYGAKSSAPYAFIKKSEVSNFVRSLLIMVGCDEIWFEQQAAKMFAAADATGNRDDLDVGAHELRSTIATFLGNGGMKPKMLDAYLGHENSEIKKGAYSSWDDAEEICHIIERCIPYGSLCTTKNPALSPVVVDKPQSYRLTGNTAYRFHFESDIYVELDLSTLESGDAILIQMPAHNKTNALQRRTFPDTVEDRRDRPILPILPDKEKIEQWINEAQEIDLRNIIKKYGGQCEDQHYSRHQQKG